MSSSATLDITIPGDKSLSHRALMFAALANGRSHLTDVLDSADVRSTAECLRRLGADISAFGAVMIVDGRGVSSLLDPSMDLDCGNSGTSTRLLAGIVAGAGRTARFVGDESLSKRPMRRVSDPLTRMGARVEFDKQDGLPMMVIGAPLQPIEHVSKSASAQVKSALLLAGLTSGVAVTVSEPARSRDHTERMMQALGVPIEIRDTTVTLPAGPHAVNAFEFDVPGDPSSAAFFAAWSLLTHRPVRTSVISLNHTRTGFLTAIARAGAKINVDDATERLGEPVGRVTIDGSLISPFTISGAEVPSLIDELPLIACLAAYTRGETRVTGAEELRVKESDRITAVINNLKAIGVDAEELPDGFVIRGERKPLKGKVETHADHRIAMAFGVLGSVEGNEIDIDDRDCVGVSFPSFWRDLKFACSSP